MSSYVPGAPIKLSPSRMKDYMQCPKMFYFKYILGIPTPITPALVKGTLAHYVFENIFELPEGERSIDFALSLIPVFWNIMKSPFIDIKNVDNEFEKQYRIVNNLHVDVLQTENTDHARLVKSSEDFVKLFSSEVDEIEFLRNVEVSVLGWFKMENPNKFSPTTREEYVFAELGKNIVHGYIDRFDRIKSKDGSEKVYISDYKTGKMPPPRFAEDAFFQLYVYSLIHNLNTGEIPHQVRLLYVNEGNPAAILTKNIDSNIIKKTKTKVQSLSNSITDSLNNDHWPTKKQVLCDWCPFKQICPEFNPSLEGILPEEVVG